MDPDPTVPTITFPNIGRYTDQGYRFMTLPFEVQVPVPAAVRPNVEILLGQRATAGRSARALSEAVLDFESHYENNLFFRDVPFSFNQRTGEILELSSLYVRSSLCVPAQLVYYHNSELNRRPFDGTDIELMALKNTVRGVMPAVVLTGPGGSRLLHVPSESELVAPFAALAATFLVYNRQLIAPVEDYIRALEQNRHSR